jgi:nucleoside-diphosphate kinase
MIKTERSYVMIKPDGVQRSLVGEIISRFERAGLKLVALKMEVPTREKLIAHYGKTDEWCEKKGRENIIPAREKKGLPIEKTATEYGREIIEQLVTFMSSGPVIMMIWQGNQAVGVVKKLVGGTEPLTSDVGTIRGDFTLDSYGLAGADERAVRNLIHCTGEVEEADGEINIWFSNESEIITYRHINEAMLYDTDLAHILQQN